MDIDDKINNLKNITENPKLLYEEENSNFLKDLKNEMKDYESFVNNYKVKIENYEDYKKVKQNFKKLKGIDELFKYIGKENIDSVLKDINLRLNKNKRYNIKENLDELKIKDDDLINRINTLISNNRFSCFIENNKLCFWVDKNINTDKVKANLGKYYPIIFSDANYTKIILKEVS